MKPVVRRRLKRIGLSLLIVVAMLGIFGFAARRSLRLARHSLRTPIASQTHELSQEMQHATDGLAPGTTPELIALTLKITTRHLHFGLSHPTRFVFDVKDREANCIEYSILFATTFNQLARWAKRHANASVAHSDEATVFGRAIPLRGWQTHEWVVVDDENGVRYFVDPTFGAYHLGWDLQSAVVGDVPLP